MQERHASQPRPRGLRRRYSGDKKHRRFGKRVDWQELKDSLTEFEFKRAFRITKELFDILLSKIRDEISTEDEVQASRSSVGAISPELRLSITLRFLAGGSLWDIRMVHKVSVEAIYDSVWRVIDAINNHEEFSLSFPFEEEKLRFIEAGFRSKSTCQVFTGVVGAIDGILIKIRRPTNKEDPNPGRFFCGRKHCHAFNAQVCVCARVAREQWRRARRLTPPLCR